MAAVIEVRYRDIPLSQAEKCATRRHPKRRSTAAWWNAKKRGKAMRIHVPGIAKNGYDVLGWYACDGPFFRIADGSNDIVCPHIAEIGD